MSPFSASDAALDGFQLIRCHWRLVVGWSAFSLLGMVAVVVMASILIVGLVFAGAVNENALGQTGTVVGLGGYALIQTLVIAAIYRLQLRGGEPNFLYLRIGPDELRLVVVGAITLAALSAVGAAAWAVGRALKPLASGAPFLAGLVAAGVSVWLALRLGLAGPVSFIERRIDFAGAWRLSRGRGWALFAMWLLNLVLVLMVWLVWWLAAFLIVGLLTGFGGAGEGAEALAAHPARYILEGASPLLIGPVILTLQQAPFVYAYQAFRAGEEPDPA